MVCVLSPEGLMSRRVKNVVRHCWQSLPVLEKNGAREKEDRTSAVRTQRSSLRSLL